MLFFVAKSHDIMIIIAELCTLTVECVLKLVQINKIITSDSCDMCFRQLHELII